MSVTSGSLWFAPVDDRTGTARLAAPSHHGTEHVRLPHSGGRRTGAIERKAGPIERKAAAILAALVGAFICVTLAAHGTAAPPQSPSEPAGAATIDASIREYLASVAVPGVAVAVTRGDAVVLTRGYGRTPAGQPVDVHTPMALASVSKSFTALAVMQLVDDGRVDLDRPVRQYLPEFTMADPRAGRITVRQLLNQTSGMSDRTFAAFSGPQPRTLVERVASLRTATLAADPGSRWEYHNPNYQVAARLVERVAGTSFDGYLRGRVFVPLGMRDSRTIDTADDLPPSARGHVLVLGWPIALPEPRAFGNGSGGVLSSAHDMAVWLIVQQQGGRAPDGTVVVSPASIAAMRTTAPASRSYALGWTVGTTPSGAPLIAHSGDLFTSTAQQIVLTESGWGIAVMANTGLIYGDARAIAGRILAVIEGRAVEPASAWPWVLLDGVMLASTAVVVVLATVAVGRSKTWGARRVSHAGRAASLLALLSPLVLWLGIHRVVGFLYRGRNVAWIQVPYLFPTFMILLTVANVCGVVVCVARLAGLAARRRAIR